MPDLLEPSIEMMRLRFSLAGKTVSLEEAMDNFMPNNFVLTSERRFVIFETLPVYSCARELQYDFVCLSIFVTDG